MRRSASERLQNFANSILIAGNAATRTERDGLRFASGSFEIVIDDGKVVTTITQHLLARAFETPANLVIGILTAGPDAALEFSARGREDEDRDRAGQLLFDLKSSLNVDFEHEILALRPCLVQPLARRAVPVLAEDLRVFQKLSGRH